MEKNNNYNPFRLLSDAHLTEDRRYELLYRHLLIRPFNNES